MGAYTDADAVSQEFRSLVINETSAVSTADVAEFISQSGSYIDSKIGKKYVLPITKLAHPNAFNILKTIQTYMVVCRIKRVLEVKNVIKEADQLVKTVDYCKEAKDLLAEVVSGDLILSDAPAASTSGQEIDSFTYQEDTQYKFKVDGEQW